MADLTNCTRFVAITAAISSSLGRVTALIRATRYFDITKETSWFWHMYTTAPYALVLAFANAYKWQADVTGEEMQVLGIINCGSFIKSGRIQSHLLVISLERGSSHVYQIS